MTILAYHSVSDREHPLAVSPSAFADQLDVLEALRIVTVAEHVARWEAGERTDDVVALTFDDAYADFAATVAPALAERHWPATVYVPAGLLGGTCAVDADDAHEGGAWPVLTREQFQDVAARPGIEIGGHGMTHALLPGLSPEQLRDEVHGCRSQLEAELGQPPTGGFCYPAGRYDARVQAEVRAAGWDHAVVTPRDATKPRGRFALCRVGIYRHDDARRFRLKLSRLGAGLLRAKRLVTNLRGP